MTDEPTNADKLGIEPGSLLWIVGDSIEETALLDPLPEGVEIYQDEPDDPDGTDSWFDETWTGTDLEDETEDGPARPSGIDVAVIAVTNSQEFHTRLDDLLPRMGSVSHVWVIYPVDALPRPILEHGVDDYGWGAGVTVPLDDPWSAVELQQP